MQSSKLFAVAPPGLENVVDAELAQLEVAERTIVPGGVEFSAPVSRLVEINRHLRVAVRVLLRVGTFRAVHLSELTRRARALPWADFVRPGQPVKVKATCHHSAIYHSGAAAERVHASITAALQDTGAKDHATPGEDLAPVDVLVRLDNNDCVISLDTSGEPLYRRGYKEDVGKAPLRENLAAGLLALCEWCTEEPLLDPMCGSGTFVLEAALQCAGLPPGFQRRFACMDWPGAPRATTRGMSPRPPPAAPQIFAFDRNAGAITATQANAERAGLVPFIHAEQRSLSALTPPTPHGLIICNPPYGQRIGNPKTLRNLYASLGNLLRGPFAGWRLGLITANPKLAYATGLRFEDVSAHLPHGGLKIRLYRFAATTPAS